MHAIETQQPGSPQEEEGDRDKDKGGPLYAIFVLLTLAAAMPALVHVMYVVGRWSWNLVG